MNIPLYKQILGFEKHAQLASQGYALTAVKLGLTAEQVKQADGAVNTITGVGDLGFKAITATSLLTGIPVGVIAHIVGKKITERTAKERDLRNEIGYYHNAAQDIEREMARQGIKRAAAEYPDEIGKAIAKARDKKTKKDLHNTPGQEDFSERSNVVGLNPLGRGKGMW